MGWLADETGLQKCAANFVPLTPLSHLNRAADVYAGRTALVYGPVRRTYAEHRARVARLASGLALAGIRPGDVVATLLPNVPAQAEATFGVPACGAVICTINTRLDAGTVAYTLDHSGAKMLLCDAALLPLAEAACAMMQGARPVVIAVPDPVAGITAPASYTDYEALLATGDASAAFVMPADEWESIALNYTSGTTGRPKGVVYHHRGAYLATTANAIGWRMVLFPVYLTIAPLFHCNGWCHTWMIPMMGGTMVCCRDITAKAIFSAIADEGVTHFGAAPIVLNTLINASASDRRPFSATRTRFNGIKAALALGRGRLAYPPFASFRSSPPSCRAIG